MYTIDFSGSSSRCVGETIFLQGIEGLKKLMVLLFCFTVVLTEAQQPATGTDTARRPMPPPVGTITPTRETPVHDPVMIKEKDKYYLFCTGNGVNVFSSKDMKNWRREMPVM